KIFDPFFTTKEKHKGTGMGLSVVHGIVTSINGVMKVLSKSRKGTEFHIYLPISNSQVKKEKIHTIEQIQTGTEQILLVDDEKAIIKMEKPMLERLGYKVTAHISSTEALKAFIRMPEKFDIVVTDMAMPNMSGDLLAVEIKKIRPDIPIILCTGFSNKISKEKAKSMGFKGFLLKPMTMENISIKIRQVLDGKEMDC
ncbi:MAG: response regulator, partial [Desulfobacteraceae bacterium]|nr:response regulator [Desulfobacteraceae bacterium]